MNTKEAKALRRAIYNESIGNDDANRSVRDATCAEDAYLYYVQRSVYQRTKRVLCGGSYKGKPEILFAEAAKTIKFLVEGFRNNQKLQVSSGPQLSAEVKDAD